MLDRILQVQKMDVHEIEGIHPLVTTILQMHAPANLSEDTPQCRQHAPCASIEAQLASPSGHKAHAGNASGESDAALERLLSADFKTAADAIRGYLTAATAKDCSLMITLAPCVLGPAPSGDSRHDSYDAAGEPRAAAKLGSSEVGLCAETSSREVSSSTAGVSQPMGELDGGDNGQCAKTGSKELAVGDDEAVARPLSVDQDWTSTNEHAVGGITGSGATGNDRKRLPSQQEDPSIGSVVQHAQAGNWFRYKVAIVDLDLKPLSKVEQHYRLDQKIMDCVLRTNTAASPGAD